MSPRTGWQSVSHDRSVGAKDVGVGLLTGALGSIGESGSTDRGGVGSCFGGDGSTGRAVRVLACTSEA